MRKYLIKFDSREAMALGAAALVMKWYYFVVPVALLKGNVIIVSVSLSSITLGRFDRFLENHNMTATEYTGG